MADVINFGPYLHRRRVKAAGERVARAMDALVPDVSADMHWFAQYCVQTRLDSDTIAAIVQADDATALRLMLPMAAALRDEMAVCAEGAA